MSSKKIAVVVVQAALILQYLTGTLAQISCPDETEPRTFVQAQLSSKTTCQELMRDECLFIHEARDKCPCLCQRLIASQSQPAPMEGSAAAYQEVEEFGNGGGGGAMCFPAEAIVQTNKGPMTMEQLKREKDIFVAARDKKNEIILSSVKNWIHANGEQHTEYIDVITESGHRLAITPLHLIYQSDCIAETGKAVMANELTVGNCLTVLGKDGQLKSSKIVNLERTQKRGFYSPLTEEGNIIVDGVLASCYSTTGSEQLQKIAFKYIAWAATALQTVLPENVFAHVFGGTGSTVPIPSVVLSLLSLSDYVIS